MFAQDITRTLTGLWKDLNKEEQKAWNDSATDMEQKTTNRGRCVQVTDNTRRLDDNDTLWVSFSLSQNINFILSKLGREKAETMKSFAKQLNELLAIVYSGNLEEVRQ